MNHVSSIAIGGITTPTLADALLAIPTWVDLTPARRQALTDSLVRIAEMLGEAPALVVLSPQFVRTRLLSHPPSAFGIGEGTMRNRRSHLRQVMVRLGVIDACDAATPQAWAVLLAPLTSREKAPFAKLVDYCTLNRIAPEAVDNAVLTAFSTWLVDRTIVANPRKLAGTCRRDWNRRAGSQAGWPTTKLSSPTDRHQYILPLTAFSEGFQQDLDRFGRRLASTAMDNLFTDDTTDEKVAANAASAPGLRQISVDVRLGHARWAASALVASGKATVAEINSLTDLVVPHARAQAILRFLYDLRGGVPWAGALHVQELLLMVARYEARVPAVEIDKLRAVRRHVAPANKGMSAARRARILAIMTPERLQLLLQLPDALMEQAMTLLPGAPRDAVALAFRAVAVQTLFTTQLRLGNVIGMKIGEHLQRPDPARGRFSRIDIPARETKNSNAISRPLGTTTAAAIALWIRHFRPHLASSADGYLFPGHDGRPHVTPQGFRDAVKGVTRRVCGVALTPHDFRALAGHIHLEFNRGDYGTVMRLLHHKDPRTAPRYYILDDTDAAVESFDALVLKVTTGKAGRRTAKAKRPARKLGLPAATGRKPFRKPRGPAGDGAGA